VVQVQTCGTGMVVSESRKIHSCKCTKIVRKRGKEVMRHMISLKEEQMKVVTL